MARRNGKERRVSCPKENIFILKRSPRDLCGFLITWLIIAVWRTVLLVSCIYFIVCDPSPFQAMDGWRPWMTTIPFVQECCFLQFTLQGLLINSLFFCHFHLAPLTALLLLVASPLFEHAMSFNSAWIAHEYIVYRIMHKRRQWLYKREVSSGDDDQHYRILHTTFKVFYSNLNS